MNEFQIIWLIVVTVMAWSWALTDLIQTHFISMYTKILCLFLIVFLPILGSISYFQIKRYLVETKAISHTRD